MAKAFCEDCQDTAGISPTPEPVAKDKDGNPIGSARRWRLDVHPVKGSGRLCDGSGKLV